MKNILHIQRGEGAKVLTLCSYLFCVVGAGIAGKAARDSYFLSRYDKSLLPIMLVACAGSVVLAVTVYTRLCKWAGSRTLFHLSNAVFVATLVLISLRLRGWVIPFLYVWTDVVNEINGLQFWLLAADILNPREAKRLLGPIGTGSALAGVGVGFGLKPFVRIFGSGSLLYLVAGMVAASWVLALIAGRYAAPVAPAHAKPVARTKRKRLDPYLGTIAVVMAVSAAASLLVDYQFKIVAARSIASEGALASFFGQFYAGAGIASLAVQLVLSSFVLSRYGILAGLLILPVLMGAGSFAILFRPTLLSALFAKGSDQTFKHTLNRSSLELLWLPVPPRQRETSKPFIGSSVKSSAEAVAGLATFFLVKAIALQYLSLIAIAATAVWIYASVRLKSLYVTALARAIEKRQIDFEELTVDAGDPAMVAAIRRALESRDVIQTLFVLDLIADLSLEPWTGTLQQLLREGPEEVRKRILVLAGQNRNVVPDAMLAEAMEEESAVGAQAILAAGERDISAQMPRLAALLSSAHVGTRLAAAFVLRRKRGPVEDAGKVLAAALDGESESERKAALELLAGDREILTPARLRQSLRSQSDAVREAALLVAGERRDETMLPAVVGSLALPATAACARRVLKSFAEAKVLARLSEALSGATPQAKAGIVRALRDYPGDAGVAVLLRAIEPEDMPLFGEIADALLAAARSRPLPEAAAARLEQERMRLIRMAYEHNRTLCLLAGNADAVLLREWLETAIGRIVPLVLKLAAAVTERPQAPIEKCIRIVESKDAARLPFVLEFLDSILPRAERPLVDPLIEPIAEAERDIRGAALFPDLPADLPAVLVETAYARNHWRSAIALDAIRRTARGLLEERLDWQRVPDSALCREVLTRWNLPGTPPGRRQEEITSMYSTLEKTIFLKSVDLFGRIPAEMLSRIAQVSEEKRWAGNTPIFLDGDQGSSMFVVLDGAVRIHMHGRELAVLNKGECFGEMSLLDGSPRSADATTLEDCTLLELQEDDFYEALSGNVEIAHGIIRLLAERLRDANRKLA